MTAAELDELKAELELLETQGREEIAEQIRTARGWGDAPRDEDPEAARPRAHGERG
jgi:transcription elongation GreA/GreB family factor